MANEEHLKILKLGVEMWNRWRAQNTEIEMPDLSGVNLAHAKLSSANMQSVDLSHADLRRAYLSHANLTLAKLTEVNLDSADLTYADLNQANLCRANVANADLSYANLSEADLTGVDFKHSDFSESDLTRAEMWFTILADCDLSNVRGLDSIKHFGPSTVGIDTIYKSEGRITQSFLRGCGAPESFITQVHSLVSAERGIQFYSCFVSYSSKDEEFTRRLYGRMRDAHLRVWFAPKDMPGGKKLHEVIDEAIRAYDKLLIVLSEASLKSEWVITELRKARKAERQSGKRKLFPVRLVDFERLRDWECFDADSGNDLAVELREYFIPDFSHWQEHDQFEDAFARLLQALRADARAK